MAAYRELTLYDLFPITQENQDLTASFSETFTF